MDKKIYKFDQKHHFYSIFDPGTGFYIRSGILKDGIETDTDSFMASFPELIDIGVMGQCVYGRKGLCVQSGVQCYQDGMNVTKENMALSDFVRIIDECRGKVFQIAMGGRGDPDQHENFEDLLKCCRQSGIVPNFTTSGLGFHDDIAILCKKYCGAVAVSWYRSEYTLKAIDCLVRHKVKTNIHYVLGDNSIDEAIKSLQTCDFPKGINSVIFLLHKPVGLGKEENVLRLEDSRIQEFFQLVDGTKYPFKVGFDSCTVPGLLNYCKNIDETCIDTCEGGRWSAYITSDMKMLPCSFDNRHLRWSYDISNDTIQNAWDSDIFEDFRSHFRDSCPSCGKRKLCMGGCPICRSIILCKKAT